MEMDISEDLGTEDVIVHEMTPSTILMSESGTSQGVVAGGGGLGSAELGRRLLLAARQGDTPLVLDLMAKGAPFTTDWLGTSALHAAAAGAHAGTCAVLLRAGVSRDCRTKVERTPLHLAAHHGHAPVAALLLQHRANVDCRDMLRMTPLHWAAARGHAAVAELLLRHGADALAVSKFNKTARALAAAAGRRDIVKLIDDALKEREAARSVESLRAATETEATDSLQNILDPDGSQEAKPTSKRSPQPEIKIDIENPHESGGAAGAGAGAALLRRHGIAPLPRDDGSTVLSALQSGRSVVLSGEAAGAGAALLRRHGIAPLPRDDGSTVLSALQSGRSVVLSDAGKLMLKESSEIPQVVKIAPTPSKGVVLTATPVKSPPRQGVKIFTLNNKLLAMPKENKAPVKKVINPHDSMQVKYIKVASDAKLSPVKAKHKAAAAGRARLAAAVKLTLQKGHATKLLGAGAGPAQPQAQTGGEAADGRSVLFVPEEFLTNNSAKYLRTQLLTAHKTIASLSAQLNSYKTRLAKYEDV